MIPYSAISSYICCCSNVNIIEIHAKKFWMVYALQRKMKSKQNKMQTLKNDKKLLSGK